MVSTLENIFTLLSEDLLLLRILFRDQGLWICLRH
jgi:hypothetical protein